MSSTRNLTILHGIQLVQITLYFNSSGIVCNNSCTASQRTLASWMSHFHNIWRQETSISFGHCTALCGGQEKWWHVQFISFQASLQESNEAKNHAISPIKKRLHESQFLRKLSCQKTYWDQARLSSLLNKQVEPHVCQVSHIMCYMSNITSQVSHVTLFVCKKKSETKLFVIHGQCSYHVVA